MYVCGVSRLSLQGQCLGIQTTEITDRYTDKEEREDRDIDTDLFVSYGLSEHACERTCNDNGFVS